MPDAPAAPAPTLVSDSPATPDPSLTPAALPAWSWAKEDGAFNEGWRDKLPDGLGADPSLAAIGSMNDLAKSYVSTKKLLGTKLEMPGENATPEAIANWRKTVGAPETPEGYRGDAKSLRPEIVPEAMWDVAGEKKFLDLAHKHSLPPAAVKEILGLYGENIKTALDASQATEGATLQAEGTKLREAWGKDYDSNLNMAVRVAATVGMDKMHPAFTDASVVQAFAKMGKLLSEDRLVKGESTGVNGGITDRIRDITDPKSTSVLHREYNGEFGPERQAAAQQQLHQLMAAQEQK